MSLSMEMQGKWESVLPQYVDNSYLTGKHMACPICETGKDRFRFDNKEGRGTYFCAQCGSGDGFDLIMKVTGKDFKTIANELQLVSGNIVAAPIKAKQNFSPILDRIARDCQLITETDHVSAYLRNRGLTINTKNVRFAKNQPFYSDGKIVNHFDAMVARVTDVKGARNGLHITYLQDGKKAPVQTNRKLLKAVDSLTGSYVQLGEIEAAMVIGEGIETTLAGMKLFDCSGLASINTSLMQAIRIPDQVMSVAILADNDKKYAGQKAAYTLANRLVNEGKTVTVEIPEAVGSDFADMVMP